MKNIAKAISMLMIASFLLGFAVVLPIHAAENDSVKLFVDPENYFFSTDALPPLSQFTVNVTIANVSRLAGLNFKLNFDPMLLEVVPVSPTLAFQEVLFNDPAVTYDSGNIWKVKNTYDNVVGFAQYGYTWQDMAAGRAGGYVPTNITTTQAPFWAEGKHAAAIVRFHIKKLPTKAEGFVTCNLTLTDYKAGDDFAVNIPFTGGIFQGVYKLTWAAPTTLPHFEVEKANYTALNIGDLINVNVLVKGLDAAWEAVGFEFKLHYDSAILDVLSVTEGPWLPPFGAPPNQGTLFMKLIHVAPPYVQVGDVVLPDVNSTWHTPFPSGDGVLATITFNATAQGLFPVILQCPLKLNETKVADQDGVLLNQTDPVSGWYSIASKVLGRKIDIYTQYPFPFGGQGLGNPSDMFWPQKEVCITAEVTYNEWPEQQKDVAFEIWAPNSQFPWGIIYARTNENGIATACFRLPWPCDNPEQYIGVWRIIGTVDIACMIMNDTLEFHYDYLVRIWKVTADKSSYKHNETICVTVEFGSHSQQNRTVVLALTALDETGVPFGFNYLLTWIGDTVFCQYRNYTAGLCVFIPKWARAGTAELDVAFLDDWPFMGGTVQSGYFDGEKWLPYYPLEVIIEAAWA